MNIETKLRIPDLWFDFYARFLPGCAFVSFLWYFAFNQNKFPDYWTAVTMIILGYICALITQPISSEIVLAMEYCVQRFFAPNKDVYYIKDVQRKLGTDSRKSMILSKMHGEVTFYIQLVILGLCALGLLTWKENISDCCIQQYTKNYLYLGMIIIFIEACFVELRRLRRAKREDEMLRRD